MASWYVATTGDDTTGDGSQGNPWLTIAHAIGAASTTDTIWIENGAYAETAVTAAGFAKALTIRSVSGLAANVVITATTLLSPGTSVVRCLWGSTNTGFALTLLDVTLVLDYSLITSGWNTGYYYGNGLLFSYQANGNLIIARCFFLGKNLPDSAARTGFANAIQVADDAQLYIYKNTFRGFKNNGFACAVYSVYLSQNEITSLDNIYEDCDYGIFTKTTGILVTENYNSFYNNTHNWAYGATAPGTDGTLGANSITSDPLFVTAGSADISNSSPCIDAGTVVTTYVESYTGNAPDIGCYESSIVNGLLVYTGTYNNGSDSGSVDLGSSVISIGRLSEILLGGVNRPWCQQTTVVLDDSDSYFLGTLANGTDWYNGTFNIWAVNGTSWEKLMTGFVPASAWSYDYSQKTVTLQVNSMLKRAASISMGFGGSLADSQDTFTASSNFCTLLGTITVINPGTVTVTQYGAQPQHPILNSYLWDVDDSGSLDTSNQGAARLASFQGWTEGGSGTWSLDCQLAGGTAAWMKVGAVAAQTVPYPSAASLNAGVADGYPGIQMFFYQSGTHMGLTWDATNWTKFISGLAIVPLACEPMVGTQLYSTVYPFGDLPSSSVGTAPLYYGGGLWFETMTDLMNSVGANWTVDGNGVIRAKIKRAAALEAVTGTVSFTDAEDDLTASWTFSSTEGPALVMVEHEWNNYDERLTGTALSTGSMNTGDTMSHQAKWQRGIGGALLAERLMKWEQRIGRIFALSYPVSFWGSFVPGSLVALENIPDALNPDYNASSSYALLTAGKYVVQARHYDYMDYRVVTELRQVPPLTGVFILDISELDGPDKLY